VNEAIRVRLKIDGKTAAIAAFSAEGLTLDGETSASPRGIGFSLQPANEMTEFRLRRMRTILDRAPGASGLQVALEDGCLRLRGDDPASLPFGVYNLRLTIADLQGLYQPIEVEAKESRTVEAVAEFRTDTRRIKLTTPVAGFDPRILAVVSDPASRLDGMNLEDWLAGPARASRKACLLNVLAVARATRGPSARSTLIEHVKSVLCAETDRIYVAATAQLLEDLQTLSARPARPVYAEGSPKAAIHRRLLDRVGPAGLNLEPDADAFRLLSFRCEGSPSLQLVVASPPGGDPARPHYADLDLDLGNPLQDLAGLFTHFGEVLDPGQTDHLELAKKLARGSADDFCYYRVVRGETAG
jgi:hypothetical protein